MMPSSLKYGIRLPHAAEGARVRCPRAGVQRQAAHVRFVDHAESERPVQRPIPAPVEVVGDDDALGHAGDIRGGGHGERPGCRGGSWPRASARFHVKLPVTAFTYGSRRSLLGIEAVTPLGLPGPVDAVQVAGPRARRRPPARARRPRPVRAGDQGDRQEGREPWGSLKRSSDTAVACRLNTENCVPRRIGGGPEGQGRARQDADVGRSDKRSSSADAPLC